MEEKYKYLNGLINEALEEITTDYDTFDQFKKGSASPGAFFVYSQVDKASIPNIIKNGAEGSKEYIRNMIYGRGLYTVMSYKDCASYSRFDAMVKYIVKKGAFDNFLIFDMGIRRDLYSAGILTLHEKISTTVKRLFSPQDVKMLERYYGPDLAKLDSDVMSCDHSVQSNYYQERFLHIVREGEGMMNLYPGMRYESEKRLDESNVDGWIYFSYYGSTAIFRTMDLLAPYSYGVREGWSGKWPPEKDFKYCIEDEENFNNINISTDAFRRARKDYPDTSFTEKTVCGFSLVRKGNKFNLLNARTNKYFSPLDFDACQVFDPLQGTTQFSIVSPEEGIYDFRLTSEERGKNVRLQYKLRDEENMDAEWEDIDYGDFVDVMKEFKEEQKQQKQQPINEVFTHKDYKTFKSGLGSGNNVFVYRATSPETAKIEFENGSNMEFSGTSGDSSLYYGLGVYTVRNTESLLCSKYGRGVVKFLLKDGYKDFIILDDGVRAKHDPGKTVYDELVRLVPKNILDEIDQFFKGGRLGRIGLNNWEVQRKIEKMGIDAFKDINVSSQMGRTGVREFNTASFARALKLALQGHNMHDKLASAIYDELLMAKTKIRGFVFNGGADGNVVMIRDFNALMPVDYSVDCGKTWIGDFTEANFNKINQKVDPFYSYRGEYETTDLRTKPICGFSMVSGKQGYNYKDIWFHRPLLPVDAESATPFDPMSRTAHFNLFGEEFEVSTDDDMNITLSYNDEGTMTPCSYEEFMEFLNVASEEGLMKGKKVYDNNLLNPATDRKK